MDRGACRGTVSGILFQAIQYEIKQSLDLDKGADYRKGRKTRQELVMERLLGEYQPATSIFPTDFL